MPPVSILPPELCDHILDCLYNDKPTLRRCALTTRNWLPRAQYHLFRSIYIDWSNCHSFNRLLDSNPALASYVGTLEIEGAFGIFSMDRLHGMTLDTWLRGTSELSWFPHRFLNLTKLELALITIDADLVHRVFGRLTTITHLTLFACALTSFDLFVDLFASFPHLTRLSIAYTQEWETGSHPLALAPLPVGTVPPQLEVIDLTSCSDNFKVLHWLIAQNLHRSIHTFSCSRVPWSSLAALASVLSVLSPSLRNLRVGFGDSSSLGDLPSTPPGWTHPAFTQLSAVTSLTFDIHTGRLAVVPYTLFLLLHLPTPALRTLTFAVQCGEYDTSFLLPWTRIAEATARIARDTLLERVVVSAKERGEDGVFAGGVGAGGSTSVDFAEMEDAVRSAFAVQGMEKLVYFVRKD